MFVVVGICSFGTMDEGLSSSSEDDDVIRWWELIVIVLLLLEIIRIP